jgi:type I restriction enzyme S subunit
VSVTSERIRAGIMRVETWSPASAHEDLFRYVDISSVDRVSKSVTGASELAVEDAPSRARQLLKANDVLVSTVRPNLNAVAMVPEEFDGAIGSTGFAVLRANPARLLPRYLFHWVRTPMFVADMVSKATGASYPAVSDRIVLDSEIPKLPLAEQRHIAQLLDKADAIRKKRKEAIALIEELLRSAFQEMFGDPVKNPKGWPLRPFGELVRETQLGLVRAAAEQGDGRAFPYIRMNAIRNDGHMDLSDLTRVDALSSEVENFQLEDGDFLFNTRNSRELVGKAAVYHGHGTHLFNNNILRVRFRAGIESDFVNAYWQTKTCRQHLEARKAGTTSVFAIYYKSLATLPVPVPPASVQSQYADVCAAARKRLRAYGAYVDETNDLFNSLVTRAFSGVLEASR